MISFTNKTSDDIKDYCQEWLHINGNTFFNGIYNIAYCVLNNSNRGAGKPEEIPYYFVMCDRSIATDNVADNFDQIFNAYSKETVRRIL